MGFFPFVTTPAAATPWLPGDNNLLLANGDPWLIVNSTVALTAGTQYLAKLTARSTVTLSNLWFGLNTAGSGTSTGSFAGLLSSAGAVLTSSADADAQLTGSTGAITIALTTPQVLLAGQFVWAAIISNLSVTQPVLARSNGSGSFPNLGLTAANDRFAINGTALSVITAITPSANAGTGGSNIWVGAS